MADILNLAQIGFRPPNNEERKDAAINRIEQIASTEASYSTEELQEISEILSTLSTSLDRDTGEPDTGEGHAPEFDDEGLHEPVSLAPAGYERMSIDYAHAIARNHLAHTVQDVAILPCSEGYVLQARTTGGLFNIRQLKPQCDIWRYDSRRCGNLTGQLKDLLDEVQRDVLNW